MRIGKVIHRFDITVSVFRQLSHVLYAEKTFVKHQFPWEAFSPLRWQRSFQCLMSSRCL
ncbi:hypothetical protein D918_09050 [Trichuris suis]|nr:hypothetical protein D918_09050 [Trichuris suis]